MGLFSKSRPKADDEVFPDGPNTSNTDMEKAPHKKVAFITPRVFLMGILVSMGGLIFGYDTGQISGFLEMSDFLARFSNTTDPDTGKAALTDVRSGTIVGLLSIGTLCGALIAAPIADKFGRKYSVTFWNIIFCVGVIIQITTNTSWVQVAIGRLIAGFGVGGLSVLTPMYQAETAPRQVRGALISAYQLFITLGIFIAYCINFGTEAKPGSQSWKLPMGIGFIWPAIMGAGMLLLPESPRWDYRHGRIDRCRTTISKAYGVPEDHPEVVREMSEIKEKFDAEKQGGSHDWFEIFTAPTMLRRTAIGVILQMLQQLTGANFFFYYGTSIFKATGIQNSFVTSMILGGINFGTTFFGLYVVEKFGRRKSLIAGGLWMFMCFMVFASVGHFSLDQKTPTNTPGAGTAMIVFASLFIFGFASTWGPLVWTVVGEIYPSRYRAKCMSLATASNWTWNFLISFFTPFITKAIDFRYGYVFAAMCFVGAAFVYFFVCESQGRSLEEIDTMYLFEVKPWKSSKWTPPEGEKGPNLDDTFLTSGGRDIRKESPTQQRQENLMNPQ